jgi:hypothetical protein
MIQESGIESQQGREIFLLHSVQTGSGYRGLFPLK